VRESAFAERIRRALATPAPASSDLDLTPGTRPAPARRLRPAGVVIPIQQQAALPQVIMTRRSPTLRHHPGQIAFPGGKVDRHDSGPVQAALREAAEEIGLPRERLEILGTLGEHDTVTGFRVTPVVVHVEPDFEPVAEAGEVAEIFRVPLAHLLDLARYRVESRRWRGQRRRYYVLPYGPHYIWGATARMLHALAERIRGA